MLGLLSDLDRKNCWSIAEHRGAQSPDALQHLLSRSVWEADLVRDDLRGFVVDHLGHPDAAAVVEDAAIADMADRRPGATRRTSEVGDAIAARVSR